jgi:predicted nucleic acid-binding protein
VRTAIDTNVVSAMWSNEAAAPRVSQRLGEAKNQGALLIAPVVYAELLAYPKVTESFLNDFLSDTGITVDFQMQTAVWLEAGRRFALYAGRRRQSGLEESKRLLADFLIGSHALIQADRLVSLDATPYQRYFPELKLI